jgi:hypothetical protein
MTTPGTASDSIVETVSKVTDSRLESAFGRLLRRNVRAVLTC